MDPKEVKVQALVVQMHCTNNDLELDELLKEYVALLDCDHRVQPCVDPTSVSDCWCCPSCNRLLCGDCSNVDNALQKCGKCYGTFCISCFLVEEEPPLFLGICRQCADPTAY
jgi:hypothetical protein